jgi:exosortase
MRFKLDERSARLATLLLLGVCVLWAQWPALCAMAQRWSSDPRYAHGYFVPVFALALLRMRRDRPGGIRSSPSAWGLALLGLGGLVQLAGGYSRIESLEALALLPDLAGIALLLGGWRSVLWAWPSIAFLAFMIPLPWRVENALGPPLQFVATTASTYLLQTLGFMAFAEGFVIQLNDARIGVVEACSGLSMLITFLALSTAAALVVKERPWTDRIVLVLSAIPVALVANIVRIVLTGTLHETVGGHAASTFYHDLAGWIMMPLALVLYWLELAVLSRLLIPVEQHQALPALELVGARRPGPKPSAVTQKYKPSAL